MSHKKTLIVITILIAIVSIQFWSRDPAGRKANADPLQQNYPKVSFDRSSLILVEPDADEAKTITLNVVINKAPEQGEEVKVTVMSANGSALAGVDYLPVVEYLTFPAGSTAPQSFDVSIIGNNIHQPDRAFVVFLTNPVNATVSIPAAITIRILDNDPPTPNVRKYMPIIRGFVAGPMSTPCPPAPTPTPYSPYPTSY